MHNASDYGYRSPGAPSMRCIACGSMHLNCCDGHGNPLKPKRATRSAAPSADPVSAGDGFTHPEDEDAAIQDECDEV